MLRQRIYASINIVGRSESLQCGRARKKTESHVNTGTLALKEEKPFLSFAVQGGDSQDQNLLQFFLNVVEFGMNVQEAAEAPNINTFQLHGSFGSHRNSPGRIRLNDSIPLWTRTELRKMGYRPEYSARTSGPITAIYFDWEHHSFWGGASNHGEDYGIAW